MDIPFVYGRIAQNEDFTGREQDIARLKTNLTSGINTVIMSPRRWGKSSLVHHTIDEIKKESNDFLVCHVDVFNSKDEYAFLQSYTNAVISASTTKLEDAVNTIKKHIGSSGPKITLGDIASTMEFSLGLDFKDRNLSADEILDLPEKIAREKGKRFIVCIDEFQNVENFSAPVAFQAKLRSHWQTHQNVCYCLYGSKRHMLMNIFSQYEMPFYKFGDIMLLHKMSDVVWADFIVKRFEKTGKGIDRTMALEIANKVDCHAYYVQQYSQLVWLLTKKEVTEDCLATAYEQMLDRSALLFDNLLDNLKTKQISLLLAIAHGEENLTSAKVLSNYNLGTSANVKNLKNAIIDKDFVISDLSKGTLSIQDPLFKEWLLRKYK